MRSARIHSEAVFRITTEASTVTSQTATSVAEARQQLVSLQHELAHTVSTVSANHERALGELAGLRAELEQATARSAADHERTLLALRMVRDDDVSARATLLALRATPEYHAAFEEDEPLVTVITSTYRNWPLLRDRSIPSVLAQTYERWELIVVGDAAPDETRSVIESFGDERIQFVNLPYRGPYPDDPRDAWQISGTTPWNTGLAAARGRWIATSADDDALRPGHIESLLARARSERAEVPYGYIDMRSPDGPGELIGAFPPYSGQWNLQASLLHSSLRFLPMQPSHWVFDVPNDVALLKKDASHRRAVLHARGAGRRLLPLPGLVRAGTRAPGSSRAVLRDREELEIPISDCRVVSLPRIEDSRVATSPTSSRGGTSTSRSNGSTTSTTRLAAPSAVGTLT